MLEFWEYGSNTSLCVKAKISRLGKVLVCFRFLESDFGYEAFVCLFTYLAYLCF